MMVEKNEKLAGDHTSHISLKVKGDDENQMLFRMRRSTRLNKLMNAYCNKQSCDINSINFLFNGYPVQADQTPLDLHMEDGAEIDARIHDLNHETVPTFQSAGSHNNSKHFVTVMLPNSGINVCSSMVTMSKDLCNQNVKENNGIELPAHKEEVKKKRKAGTRRAWTSNQETILAQAWINSQLNNKPCRPRRKSGSLWKQVLEYFRKQTGDTGGTVDQMYSKWKHMEQKITKFNDIYHRMTKHRNGHSEASILELTHIEYRRISKNKPFTNQGAWAIIKNHPQWITTTSTVPPIDAHIQPQKRLKLPEAQSSSHTTSSHAQSSGGEDESFNDEKQEIPQQIQEIPASSSSHQHDREELVQKIISEVAEISKILREDLEDKKRHQLKLEEIKLEKVHIMEEKFQRKQKGKDLQFYLEPHDHLTGMQLKIALQHKEEISRRWGWE